MEMSIWNEIALYAITLVLFIIIDILWLGVIAQKRYAKALKKFMAKEPNMVRASIFYAVYIVGILVMVLVPAVNDESLGIAMFRGAAFGFFTYATYGLTNWAVVEKWPTRITFEDIAWGSFLGFCVSTLSFNVYMAIF